MADEVKKKPYLTRVDYRDITNHIYDDLKHSGFNWRDNTLKKSLSAYLLNDPKRIAIVEYFQVIIAYIMDYASNIKKTINYAAGKNDKHLN